GARRPRASLRRHALDRPREGGELPRRGTHALPPVPPQPGGQAALRGGGARAPDRGRDPARGPLPAHPPAPGGHRAGPKRRPTPGPRNPYPLGLKLWEDIERRGDQPTPEEKENLPPGKTGRDLLFQTREVDRDPSFLRRWLHEVLMRDLDLFRYEAKGDDLVVSEVSDEEGWRKVKETLVKTVGMGSIPVIRVEDADHNHNRTLLLAHL